MGTLALQIPQIGSLNQTEAPKIASDFTTLQTWANGNVDDSNLQSPMAAKRQLLLTATGSLTASVITSGIDYIYTNGGGVVAATNFQLGTGNAILPLWSGNSASADFGVPNKTAQAMLRAVVPVSASPGGTLTHALYEITSITASGNFPAIATISRVAASLVSTSLTTPNSYVSAEGASFPLPVTGLFFLGVRSNYGAGAANSIAVPTVQMYCFNA